ncbi:MAG: hypothetical protein NC301_00760 [Bacteroides sp.]|nr:hypothetical protein [Bacteroides sp.]MCM1378858.1 hypothetical protein [Bacteroides sp.]MCM1445475.1 hypothetical protein [Prevotella sp.]
MVSLYNYDGFSWRRVAMVGRYFIPALRGKVAAMAAICFAIILAACFLGQPNGKTMSADLFSTLSLAIVLTPVYFTIKPADEIFNTLPALASEKRAFIFLFSFIIIPALMLIPGSIIVELFFPDMDEQFLGTNAVSVLRSDAAGWLIAVGVIQMLAQISIGLWAAFSYRGSKRSAVTFLAVFGAISLNGIMGFVSGFFDAVTGKPAQACDTFAEAMAVEGKYLVAIWAVIFIFACYKASRAISRKQV